jgi:aryl-alcohol dehydrogenase-like predicted oxidoreductase
VPRGVWARQAEGLRHYFAVSSGARIEAVFGVRELGGTRLKVGPLGISSSYGMPAKAVEMAFERGCNYLYWGSLRRGGFAEGIRNLRSKRDQMVLVVQSYTPIPRVLEWSVQVALRRLGFDYADVLLLGLWNKPLPQSILDACRRLQEKGMVRRLAISAHDRQFLGRSARTTPAEIFHLRYNAAHRGAEADIFPFVPTNLGVVSYTATSWAQLLNPKLVPSSERKPSASDCYRFVLSHPAVHVCMTGTGTVEQTREALAALDLGPMAPDELAWMRRVGDAIHRRT